ncbi:MAG: Rieske (2Fe-2S) protein [Planctomycetaceae bacterium]
MADKKLTTEEILALARKGGVAPKPTAESPATEESVGASPSEAPAKPAAAKPSSTADILAAARAGGTSAAAPKASPAAKPGSTADILAAARAGKAGGAAAPAKPQTGGEGVKKAPAASKPVGERPSVADMVKAAREGAPTAVPAAKPKLPAKPVLPGKKAAEESTRRSFFAEAVTFVTEPFMAAWIAMGAIGAIWGLAVARFMMPNMIVEPPTKFKIGPESDYPPGTVSTKWKAERGIWVVNTDQYNGKQLIYALLSVCTHLGCTPNWLEGEQKFKCPCHGSGFYITGINFEGPAPRPLERVGIRVAPDGSLEVDKSVKFQEELGQWGDAASFVEMA